MTRTLLAAALVATVLLPVRAAQAEVTPGCDAPADVMCNMAWSPDHPSTPVFCVLWIQGRGCVIR